MGESTLMLSVVIPARNEEGGLRECVEEVWTRLMKEQIPHEIVVVADHCTDGTVKVARDGQAGMPTLRVVENDGPAGYGMAVRKGLGVSGGDAVAIMMGDGSDDPVDLVCYYRHMEQGAECVFGSRFMRGSHIEGYPLHKLALNRLANQFVRCLFRLDFADVTNAFKAYRRHVIEGIHPLLSCHFNLTVEMPLKAIIRGYRYDVVPIRWRNRRVGVSKLRIQEMGSRYLFIVLYCWLEKYLSRGDYRRA